jgi:hypothetical protein
MPKQSSECLVLFGQADQDESTLDPTVLATQYLPQALLETLQILLCRVRILEPGDLDLYGQNSQHSSLEILFQLADNLFHHALQQI